MAPGDREAVSSAFAREVEALQVAELYRNLPVGAALAYFGALLCIAVFMADGLRGPQVAWLAYATFVTAVRLGIAWAYRNSASLQWNFDPAWWARLAIFGNLLAGIQWGLLGTWLFPVEPGYRQTFSIMVITCFVGGSITAYAPVRWAHPALSIPATVPATLYIFFVESGTHLMAGFTALFFITTVIYYALRETELVAQRLRGDVHMRRQLSQLESAVESRGEWMPERGTARPCEG
jgi:hypothetical protein